MFIMALKMSPVTEIQYYMLENLEKSYRYKQDS